jgi:hypothetical protein
LNLQPIPNTELFPTQTELKLGLLGIGGKLVKDTIHLWRWNFEKMRFSLPTSYPNKK